MPSTSYRTKHYPFAAIGALIWAALVLGFYYWIHKPLTPAFARAAGGALFDLAVGFLFVAMAGGMGHKVLVAWIDITFWSVPERFAATALVGLSLLSLLVLIIGSVALTTLSIILLSVLLIALSLRDLKQWLGYLYAMLRSGLPQDRWARFVALVTLVVAIITLLLAVLPPTKWDVLTYHLAGPQQYVQQGRFYAVAHNHFLGFPQLAENLFSAQLALTGRLTGSAVLHWFSGVLLMVLVGGYTVRHAGILAGWLAVGVLVAARSVWLEMTFAYVDLIPMGLVVIALGLLEQWRIIKSDAPAPPVSAGRFLILAGMLAGFGMGVKYSALWMALALGLLVLWLGRRDGLRALLRYSVLYGGATLIVFAPWLVRNVMWYDNPVYPFAFETAEMDTLRQDWYSQPESGLIYSSDAWQLPVLPLAATFLGVDGAGTYGTDIGPLFLILLPLLLLVWQQLEAPLRAVITRALVVAGAIFFFWALSASVGSYISLQTRLVFYMFSPLAIVAGITLEALRRLPKKPFDVYFVLRALVGLALVFTVVDSVRFLNSSGIHAYFSGESGYEDEYLEHALGWHYVTMQQVNELPPNTSVRFLWEPRYLYCDDERLNCYTDSLMDAWYYARRTVSDGSAASIAASWRASGVDYLLVYEFGRSYEEKHAEMYASADWSTWYILVDDHLREIWRNGTSEDEPQYILYRWRD